MSQGIRVFRSVNDALQAGFQLYDRTSTGFLVRSRVGEKWALAIVELQ